MNKRAFSLMELMIVIVIIGIIAGFALPNYRKSVLKAYERNALMQLTALHAANIIYRTNSGAYLMGEYDLNDINEKLGINIIPNEMTYHYSGNDGTTFTVKATSTDTDDAFVIVVNQGAIIKDKNPCCDPNGPVCPSLKLCDS